MNKLIIIFLTVFQGIAATAQKPPKWVEKASKAVFVLEATSKTGVSKSGNGFFISEKGEAVASYEVFRNAEKAVVTTSEGVKLNVTQVIGADDMYGVVRFKVANVPKKLDYLKVAQLSPAVGETSYLLPSKEENKLTQGAIAEVSKMKGSFDYFRIDRPLPVSQENYPLLNSAGEVFAMSQADASGKGKTYGLSIAYIQSLHATTTDMFKRAYSEIGIRTIWSSDYNEARISLMLYASQQDAVTYLETLNDFVSTFPDNAEGYISRATHYAFHRSELGSGDAQENLDLAEADLETASKLNKNKGDGWFEKAKLIYNVVLNDSTLQYKNWNTATADEYLQNALKEDSRPEYYMLAGDIAFGKQDYEKAFENYSIVNQSNEASGLSFYFAAKCKQQMEGSNPFEIITLLDSAASKSPDTEAAGYVLEIAELKTQMGLFADVVKEYDRYWLLSGGNANDVFYYYREQAKFRSEDFEGAMSDIDKAIMASDGLNPVYYAEKASVCLRLKDYLKAQENAGKAIELQPDFASAYRILGVSQLRQEKKKEACVSFNKAKELGDAVVERLIKENCK